MAAVDDAPEVDVHDLLPSIHGELLELACPAHTCIVAQDIGPAELLVHLVAEVLDLILLGHIHHLGEDALALSLEFLLHRLQPGGIDIRQRQLSALARKRAGHLQADAARGTGDHHYLIFEVFHGRSSFLVWFIFRISPWAA
jgi:hypothetical protein